MKKILIGALLTFTMFVILSYRTTNDNWVNAPGNEIYSLPLMQSNVIVTTSKEYMLKLINKGYIVQDVDVSFSRADYYKYHYTLIKY